MVTLVGNLQYQAEVASKNRAVLYQAAANRITELEQLIEAAPHGINCAVIQYAEDCTCWKSTYSPPEDTP